MLESCLIEFFMSYKIYLKNSRHFLLFFLSFIIQIARGRVVQLTDRLDPLEKSNWIQANYHSYPSTLAIGNESLFAQIDASVSVADLVP